MGEATTGQTPRVTVIIPVYNVASYLEACLTSAVEHGLGADEVEILAVDDGSTDGSSELLDALAARLPGVRAIHQENSGGPGGPRNTGLDQARGTYVFFLDADDELAPRALGDIVAYADAHGSDMVLAKMGGLGGRKPPASMFTRTVADAHLVDDGLIRTLGPWKLYRRDLIERQGNRFPTHLSRGEDPPFVMRAYLGASRISVLADRDYYLIREREDGTNLTSTPSPPGEALKRALALLEVIVEGTEPGELRDAVMWRPVQFNVPGVLGRRLLSLDGAERTEILERLRAALRPLWTPAVARHAKGILGTKIALALDGEDETLLRFIDWDVAHLGASLRAGRAGFELDLPADLAEAIGPARIVTPAPKVRATLSTLEAAPEGGVGIGVTLTVPGAASLPPTALRLRNRSGKPVSDVASTEMTEKATATGRSGSWRCRIDVSELADGVWDLNVVLAFPDGEITRRLGGLRARGVATDHVTITGPDGASPAGVAYFTDRYENLSLDVGFTLPKHAAPHAVLRGVLDTPEGRAALLEVESPSPVTVRWEAEGTESGRELPHTALEASTILVRVPEDADAALSGLRISNAQGSVVVAPGPDLREEPLSLEGPSDSTGGRRRRRRRS